MMTELAALLASAGEAAVTKAVETAAETAVTVSETAAAAAEAEGTASAMSMIEAALAKVQEGVPMEDAVAGPWRRASGGNLLERAMSSGAKGELTLEALETAELAEEAEIAEEMVEYDHMESMKPEKDLNRVGRSLVPAMRGSYAAQFSRLSERAAVLLREAALRNAEEAALAGDAAEAKIMQKTAELLDDISRLSDTAGDYLGIASYPEFMARNSPGNG